MLQFLVLLRATQSSTNWQNEDSYRKMSLMRRLYRQFSIDPVSPSSDDEDFIFENENHVWITNDLFKHIGRSRICVLREHYLDLFSTTRTRDPKDIYSTPLHRAAAKRKHIQAVEDLLKLPNTDKNARNRFGETALLLSLKENIDANIIDILITSDCDCNIGCFRGITPLHVAALDNKINVLLKLLKKGADVNAVNNVGVTPLHLAVLASNYEIVRDLLDHNANPRLVTVLEFTPLMLALSFQDVDVRICELLCSFDIHVGTRLGNPVYCAIKGQHNFAERLILEGADVNYIGRIMRAKNSCLLEAISQNDKHLFDLVWLRFNQQLFSQKLSYFLVHFADTCNLKGTDLVDCLKSILGSEHGCHLVKVYFTNRKHSFLEFLFENIDEYKLTKADCHEIIQALPIVYYDDISYIYKKFNFNKELQDLLKSYEVNNDLGVEKTSAHMFIDLLYYNTVQSQSYNLKEILHFLKYHTPDIGFRTHFYNTFSGVGISTDSKLERLTLLYKLCEEIFLTRNMASLQELSRNKLRSKIFSCNKKPYKAIDSLPIPDMFKDILFLKLPIYC